MKTNKKNIIGIIVSLIGLFIMGFEMGRSSKSGINNEFLHYSGLFIVFVGVFIGISFNNKNNSKK